MKAQGEDVVAGIRTPNPIAQLKDEMAPVYAELLRNVEILEKHFADMQVMIMMMMMSGSCFFVDDDVTDKLL